MISSTDKRLFFHSSKSPPMSKIGGKPTVSKRTKGNPLYSLPHPLGVRSETESRNNITPWGSMRANTSNGPRCNNKGIKMCTNWRICSIPCAHSWVLKIQRDIWCSSTAVVCTDTFRMKWSSSTSPRLARQIDMPPRLSKNLSRRSETLDLRIRSQGKLPPNHRTRGKAKAGRLKTTP